MSENASPFRARTVVLLVIAGVVGFAAFLILSAYAPDIRSGRDGRAHGLSTSAVGFRGVYRLLENTGADVRYVRSEAMLDNPGLTLLTLEPGSNAERVETLLNEGSGPLLIVLPKWGTLPVDGERDRVQWFRSGMGGSVTAMLSGVADISVSTSATPAGSRLQSGMLRDTEFLTPGDLQTISGPALMPLMETAKNESVLAQVTDTEIYILSDPDFLNNQTLADPGSARAALLLLAELNESGGPYWFELVANGFGGSRNLLTLAFEPPFLAMTLCLLAAALLAGVQAMYRFGPALRPARAIAFGKRALVDNSAELLRVARREHLSSQRYAAMTREAAVAAIGNPRQLSGEALDSWLDGLGPATMPRFTTLALSAQRAHNRQDIRNAARALYEWRKAVTHEG
ncbi:DUF4350 domain-containing protein [Parasphingopyxis lamellibrachiae]|uniref:DUF4350 domain-containing protein n=1 Tax=Parasphingopyxis lamellibrachiae TaxID=680125 RepID=A0A3D9FFW5_9SPHN|nr:DUF4350 domain-containing protein [Parasphingopyxis lamellibrachiae]RED16528.1 hypothetical protein DFR46_1552 [Parasphingopyxis lamellibrachiae]